MVSESFINVQFRSWRCLLSLHKSQLSTLMDSNKMLCSYLRLLLSPRRKAASEKPEDGQNVSELKIVMGLRRLIYNESEDHENMIMIT